jgi:hypothetical protein
MDFNMKKLITLALIVGATTLTQAQSNLVFNQVLNFTVSSSVSATVPEGKVWKVEHNTGDLRIDKADVAYGLGISNVPLWNVNKPTWYSEGTVLFTSSSFSSLSILEFNVVPTSTTTGGSGGGVSADGLVFSGIINQFIPTSSVEGRGIVAGAFTVPEGKIWKINNMTHQKISGAGNFINLAGSLYLSMDGVPIYAISGINVNTSYTGNHILTPGTYELKWWGGTTSEYCGTNTHLIAIEYNIP